MSRISRSLTQHSTVKKKIPDRRPRRARTAQFTCFTSTKVQILTPDKSTNTDTYTTVPDAVVEEQRAPLLRGQYLYFCTSKGSKLSTCKRVPDAVVEDKRAPLCEACIRQHTSAYVPQHTSAYARQARPSLRGVHPSAYVSIRTSAYVSIRKTSSPLSARRASVSMR
jgi:hypothetical protein